MFCILFNLQNVSWFPESKFWHERHRERYSFCLYLFVPRLLPWKLSCFFSFLLPLIHLPFLCLMCRPVCYAVCAPLVLCHCWRMQPSKVASLFLPLLGSTPEACGCLPRAFDSFIMWLGCSFSTSPLLMGIWAISRPLLLLVLQWIIMYIYHPMFLPVWYPWGLIFMRETDGLKSKYICNFGRYCQIPPPSFHWVELFVFPTVIYDMICSSSVLVT